MEIENKSFKLTKIYPIPLKISIIHSIIFNLENYFQFLIPK